MGILNKLFGIEIRRPNDDLKTVPSFVPRESDDGAMPVAAGGAYGTYVDLDGSVRSITALINKYREMAEFPEVDWAIDDIVNQGIVQSVDGKIITLNLDDTTFSENIKEKIRNEFEYIQKLYKFNSDAYKIFRQWYIDGRLFYHVVVDPNDVSAGIKELRYIDPRKIRVVRETNTSKPASPNQVPVVNYEKTYYMYNDKGFQKSLGNIGSSFDNGTYGVKIAKDSIIYVPSGLLDKTHTLVVSFLHKCIKPLNNLRAMQDALVIYRICVVGDTRIKTEFGTKYIKDIEIGDNVYVFTVNNSLELSKVKNKWMTGTKPVYRVKSKHFEVTATETHPILVFDKTTNICSYVPISEIDTKKHSFVYDKPEDTENLIALIDHRNNVAKFENYNIWVNLKINGKEKLIKQIANDLSIKKSSVRNFLYGIQYLNEDKANEILDYVGLKEEAELDIVKEKYWWNQINLPPYVDEDFARLFGFLIGDGSINDNGITFAEGVHPKQNEYYANLLRRYFGNCERHKDGDRKYVNWHSSTTLGANLLKELGFISGAKNKRIPEWVFAASNNIKEAFIRGFADADAHIRTDEYTGRWQAEFGLCNKRLIEDIKDLWTELGYSSSLIRYTKNDGGHVCVDHVMPPTEAWHVYISDKKLQRFEKIDSIEHVGIEEVYDIEVEHEKHNFIANGIIVHNSRASERRIFYIDVGNMPKPKAEQYMNDIMTRYKNKLSYDASTGDVIQMSKVQTLMEDFWLPRREGGRGTEISTLPAAANLSEIEDILYFQKLLYKALNVPTARLESSSTFNLGRGAEISRDEDKFADFITRLRLEFSNLFIEALEKQLIFKEIITVDDWENNQQNIHVRYADNSYYAEMRDNEIINMRVETLNSVSNYIGKYFSRNWVMKNVLRMTEDDIANMLTEIESEREDNNNLELTNQLDDLKIKAVLDKAAAKLGVIIDPKTGEPMPPEMLPPPPEDDDSQQSDNDKE